MATAWVRSLSCKSLHAFRDVAVAPSPVKKQPPFPVVSCAATAAADVMDAVTAAQQARKKKLGRGRERRREARERHEPRPQKRPKKKPMTTSALFVPSPAPPAPAGSAFLTMAELPEGHSSRRVVELIFSSGWGRGSGGGGSEAGLPPVVEALFRVHSEPRAVARFEEARAAASAHGAAARCAADGNEMMRFQCSGASADVVFGAGVATCRVGAAVSAVRTFACSGAAHASAGGAGRGGSGTTPSRRAMLVCRVIAGRVRPASDPATRRQEPAVDYDSVDMGNGELVVLDSRAVLPCFLIIYKV